MGLISKDTERLCIKTTKVYDWITRQVDVQLSFTDTNLPKFKCNGSTEDTVADLCNFLDEQEVECNVFLSDAEGNPIDPGFQEDDQLIVQEIGRRQPVTVTLPNGDQVTLQRVKALIRGFVTVQLEDDMGVVCRTKHPIPFHTTQTFLLCAPEGTDLSIHVSFVECDATLICEPADLQSLDIDLTLCLEVQTEADVKVEIEGRFCQPREELVEEITVCPTEKFPPQCPEVFPAH